MQFEHPHGFRPQVRDLLLAEWPAAWQTWLELGAVPIDLAPPGASTPGRRRPLASLDLRARPASRRAPTSTGLTVEVGRVDGLVERNGAVAGVVVGRRRRSMATW